MKPDPEYLRRHYAALSDEALLSVGGDDLVDEARKVYLGPEHGWVDVQVVRGTALVAGDVVAGPAVIEHPGTTIFIGVGQAARIDHLENTVITTGTPTSTPTSKEA